MSSDNALIQHWITTEQPYTLEYELLQSVNPYFEEFELSEYGVCCKLYDKDHHLLSEEKVNHITPNENVIKDLINKLVVNKVFPVHLLDVVSDELVRDYDFNY